MGRLGDVAAIHYRMLNRTKGPATRGTRVQADRCLYRAASQAVARSLHHVTIIETAVDDIWLDGSVVRGVILANGDRIPCASVIVTAGTFLGGVVHIGQCASTGGRMGDPAATALATRLRSLGLPLGRLKTGTPPRLHRQSINWSVLDAQPSDPDPTPLSFMGRPRLRNTVDCALTETNARTHDIIRANLKRSALFGGNISGAGPRYCPSIEDKVTRFSTKESHRIFLEPEGRADPLVYPNGISTSLPAEVQLAYVQSIRGLERAEIVRPGYAIEYDYLDPRSLDARLSVKDIPGLYFAGQVNGTTGYEEAAAQGVVAGVNAALTALGERPIVLDRQTAVIGVMIDDLITQGVSEPYRMFTSRAEHRLSLRTDNADQRLTPRAIELGLASARRARIFAQRQERMAKARSALTRYRLSQEDAERHGWRTAADGSARNGLDLIAHAEAAWETLAGTVPFVRALGGHERRTLHAEAVYSAYLERERRDISLLARSEAVPLPVVLDYGSMPGLSSELREKLSRLRPANLGQAARIEGVTPAALVLIAGHAQRLSAGQR